MPDHIFRRSTSAPSRRFPIQSQRLRTTINRHGSCRTGKCRRTHHRRTGMRFCKELNDSTGSSTIESRSRWAILAACLRTASPKQWPSLRPVKARSRRCCRSPSPPRESDHIDARITESEPLGEFAVWRAARAVGNPHQQLSRKVRSNRAAQRV